MTLINLYTRIYSDVRWPAPLPRPEDVRLCWNRRFETTDGACYPKEKIIEVNVIYRDPRLSRELEYLMIHEAAHFIWRDHSPAFRAFLRSVGYPRTTSFTGARRRRCIGSFRPSRPSDSSCCLHARSAPLEVDDPAEAPIALYPGTRLRRPS